MPNPTYIKDAQGNFIIDPSSVGSLQNLNTDKQAPAVNINDPLSNFNLQLMDMLRKAQGQQTGLTKANTGFQQRQIAADVNPLPENLGNMTLSPGQQQSVRQGMADVYNPDIKNVQQLSSAITNFQSLLQTAQTFGENMINISPGKDTISAYQNYLKTTGDTNILSKLPENVVNNIIKGMTTKDLQDMNQAATTQALLQKGPVKITDLLGNTSIATYNPSTNSYSITGTTPNNTTNASTTGNVTIDHNNPMAVTLGAGTQKYVDNGQATVYKSPNGKSYLSFKDASMGFRVGEDWLFNNPEYANLTVDQALKKWSGGTYGGEIVQSKGVDPAAYIRDIVKLSNQKEILANAIAIREGYDPKTTDLNFKSSGTPLLDATIKGIMKGTIPPPASTGTRPTKYSLALQGYLAENGFNLSNAQLQWQAAQAFVRNLNNTQMIRFNGLATSVVNTIDEVNKRAQAMKLGGVPALNHAELTTWIQLNGNSPGGQAAVAYLTAVNTLKEEFANLANGGYAPTDAAWALANSQINGNYGVDELSASLNEVQRLINFRTTAIFGASPAGSGGDNLYYQGSGTSKTLDSGRIIVKSKDGKIGTIPSNQLQQALDQGYTQQ